MRFQGRIALVTAGGRGIGRATAEIIGREGGTVVLVDTDKAALDETTGAIRARGGAAHALAADALDAAQVESVVRRKVQEHKRIDRKSTRLNSSHTVISYAVFCLKKKRD